MNSWDFVVLIVYLLIIFSIGIMFTRRAHRDTENYFLSGRNLPWWIAGTSIVATSFSCDTPLYVCNLVRTGGVWLNWQWWAFAVGSLFSAFFLARLWRRANVMTDIELTELRYGGKAGRVLRNVRAGWFALLINTYGMSWVILAMAKIIGVLWGGPKFVGVVAASLIAVSYSFFAGFWGVVVTDVAQFIIAMLGAVLFAVLAVREAGGMEQILDAVGPETVRMIPTVPDAGLFSFDTWTGAFGGFLIYLSVFWWANQNSDGGGKAIQRMLAAKNEAHAFGATLWFNIAHFALRTWPWVLVALASIVLIPDAPLSPSGSPDHELPYPLLILHPLLPSPLKGLLVAGLIAAFMSTIDTQLNWGASYLTHDIYRNRIAPNRSEKHYILIAKLAMIILIVITSFIAYRIQSVTAAFQFLLAFGAGAGPVYVLRWFWWRVGAWTEIAAMLASTVFSILLFTYPPMVPSNISILLIPGDTWLSCGFLFQAALIPYHLKLILIVAASAAIFIPVTFIVHPPKMDTLCEFYQRTDPPGFWSPVRKELRTRGIESGQKASLFVEIFGWFGGILLTFGLTFAIGAATLHNWSSTVLWSVTCVLGGIIVYFWFSKRFPKSQ